MQYKLNIMRRLIINLLAIGLIALGWFGMRKMGEQKPVKPPVSEERVTSAYTQLVKNASIPIEVKTSGKLVAKDKVEIFAEVQGVFENSNSRFRPGDFYKKGSLLVSINSDEYESSIRAQKSALLQQLVALLPDLKLDYPAVFATWDAYVESFDVNKSLAQLPQPTDKQEKLFLTGKGIYSTYYNIKNMEERLAKYQIYAPFSGVLTQSTVYKGTLIRAGQKLGELINPNVFELEIALNTAYANWVKVGKKVKLLSIQGNNTWTGVVKRVNATVNTQTQTMTVFVEVQGKDLHEGMYLDAIIEGQVEEGVFEVDRSLLTDDNSIYVVKDSVLQKRAVEIVHFTNETAIVRGLQEGVQVLERTIPGAYNGMHVNVLTAD